jgi:hypothetical protein
LVGDGLDVGPLVGSEWVGEVDQDHGCSGVMIWGCPPRV